MTIYNVVRFLLLSATMFIVAAKAYGEAVNVKEIYQIDDKLPSIDGIEYPVEQEIDTIFAVPEKNAVGTNALNNAITLIKFNNGKLKFDQVRKNFLKYVYGGDMVFLPEFSNDTIGYSQTRGFLLFNIKDRTFKDFIIGKRLEITIDNISAIDAEKNHFIFQLNYSLGTTKDIKVLKLMDLSKDKPIELASYDIEKKPMYAQLGKTTFHFTKHEGKRKLHALNEKLEPIEHPLLHSYNTKSDEFGRFGLPIVHPQLPLAVFSEKNPKVAKYLITRTAVWNENLNIPILYKLLGDTLAGNFQFSPDGKWLLYQDDTFKKNMLWVMPIIPELPHLLGKPIMLDCNGGMLERIDGKLAWISDPLSVVVTFDNKLIKWDLADAEKYRKAEIEALKKSSKR